MGKTTVIRRVAAQLEGKRLRGFYTEEIREGGERRGFRLVNFDGKESVIAHVAFPKTQHVGKYGVDVTALDEAASLLAPNPAAQVYLVDEIGKMECLSERFVAALRGLLAGQTPVVAAVGLRGGGFIAEVKWSKECLVWEVTLANRDELASRVVSWLAGTARLRNMVRHRIGPPALEDARTATPSIKPIRRGNPRLSG